MSKNDIEWLLNCSVGDINWKAHLESASLKDLNFVLSKWGNKAKTGKLRIEAKIRKLKRRNT